MEGGGALGRPYLAAVRFIHTADWHLGQTLLGRSRRDEQAAALDWLYETALAREADGMIVAGDVFDVASPAEDARKLYYDFLARLGRSPLSWVVVVAGNHDSARMLSNVEGFARQFDIHIVARPSEDCAEDLIPLRRSPRGEVEGVVAAVPFLQEAFVRRARAGESPAEAEEALAAGVHAHFDRLDEACAVAHPGVPRIATGHLYASGASAREGQDNIYVGNVRNLDAGRLPRGFDYVALGHIHRPQCLRGADHVRYSGSLIALDFAECRDEKGAWCVDLAGPGEAPAAEWVASPTTRRLKQFGGEVDEVAAAIEAFGERHRGDALRPWAEVELAAGFADHKARERLRSLGEDCGVEILKFTRRRSNAGGGATATPPPERLDELSVEEVFRRRIAAAELDRETAARIDRLFRGALDAARVEQAPEAAA